MTATQSDSHRYTRRGVIHATAVGVGAAAGIGAVGSPVGMVEAVDWKKIGTQVALAAVSPPVALGWALREYEILGSDSPAEGLTPDALKQKFYQAARTRASENASTIVDNQNILKGVENTAYTEAKKEAIEELNAGSTESDVLNAATGAIDSYETTIRSNFLKSWNESVNELNAFSDAFASQPDAELRDVIGLVNLGTSYSEANSWANSFQTSDELLTMPDGTEFRLKELGLKVKNGYDNTGTTWWDPIGQSENADGAVGSEIGTRSYTLDTVVRVAYDGTSADYMDFGTWNQIYTGIDTTFQNVRDGIETWVSSVYGEVQSGEIEISELITPSDRAAMLSDDETEARAIADLAALNIPIDPEREATVTITETSATLSGTIGLTDESDGPIESGTTYDPSTFNGDVYFTADVSQITGTWDAYETGVDGGTITLTAEPYEGTVLDVTTTAGETVSVPTGDWADNGDGTWSYDASEDLETTITEVDSVSYGSASDETQYETLNLSKEFTVDSIVNRQTGEEESSASFESSEPQTDSNYITQEEWSQIEEQNQELIDKYEHSQNTGGAGGGFFEGESPNIGLIAAVVGGAGLVYALFGQGES